VTSQLLHVPAPISPPNLRTFSLSPVFHTETQPRIRLTCNHTYIRSGQPSTPVKKQSERFLKAAALATNSDIFILVDGSPELEFLFRSRIDRTDIHEVSSSSPPPLVVPVHFFRYPVLGSDQTIKWLLRPCRVFFRVSEPSPVLDLTAGVRGFSRRELLPPRARPFALAPEATAYPPVGEDSPALLGLFRGSSAALMTLRDSLHSPSSARNSFPSAYLFITRSRPCFPLSPSAPG